jgi:hypothetical protein
LTASGASFAAVATTKMRFIQLTLSRGSRRRPRSQRGIGTGSRIDSNGLWYAAMSSRLGRSSSSRNSFHGGPDFVRCGGGCGDGACGRRFPNLIVGSFVDV